MWNFLSQSEQIPDAFAAACLSYVTTMQRPDVFTWTRASGTCLLFSSTLI